MLTRSKVGVRIAPMSEIVSIAAKVTRYCTASAAYSGNIRPLNLRESTFIGTRPYREASNVIEFLITFSALGFFMTDGHLRSSIFAFSHGKTAPQRSSIHNFYVAILVKI